MAAVDLAALMDAVAAQVIAAQITPTCYAYPAESVPEGLVGVVGYPDEIDFDATMQRGSDKVVLPLYLVLGKPDSKATRDLLSQVVTGARGIKDNLDGQLGGAVQSCEVQDMKVVEVTIGGVVKAAAKFTLEVYT